MHPDAPRFTADVMLGTLARWLRLAGLDTFYSNHAGDDELLDVCRREERILLSKDTGLIARLPPSRVHAVAAVRLPEQLREVWRRFHLGGWALRPRCSRCNGELAPIEAERIRLLVPPYVFLHCREFTHCRSCGKIYWRGTHLPRIEEFLRGLDDSS